MGDSILRKHILLLLIVVLLFSSKMAVYADEYVEIFDIKQEQVIKSIEMNQAIKKEALKLADGITGMCMRFRPVPVSGYMIGIPIEPGEKLHSKWGSCTVKRLIVIIPEKGDVILGVFDDREKFLFYNVKGSATGLLRKLDFPLPLLG